MSIHSRTRAGIVAGVSAAMLVITLATPSAAAINPLCAVTPIAPTTNGTTVSHRTGVSCSNGAQLVAQAGTSLQRSLITWTTVQTMVYSTGVAQSRVAEASFNCNGSGTYTYRTRGYGKDVNGGESYVNSASRSLTC